MMRASVLIIISACVSGVAACRDNPGFGVPGDSVDREGTTGFASSGSGETGESTAAGPCEPVLAVPDDGCDPWHPLPTYPANIADQTLLEGRGCEPVTLRVKRVNETEIWECPDNCDSCEPSRTIQLGDFSMEGEIAKLIPEVGTCAYLKHFGKPGSNPCRTDAYAAWDADDGALYFAWSSAGLDVFDTTPEVAASLTITSYTPCDAALSCSDLNAKVPNIQLEFGDCSLNALQGQTWTNLRHDGHAYAFTLDSAFDCLNPDGDEPAYSWRLRRQ